MNNEEDNKKAVNTFNVGTDSDTSPEFIKPGLYVDSANMEDANAVSGASKGLSKIAGESVLYDCKTDGAGHLLYSPDGGATWLNTNTFPKDWVCIGVPKETINDHVVEFWVHSNGYNIIRIDGIIMCYTDAMGLSIPFPLQIDTNDSCVGGEVFITDNNIAPYIFNIQEIIDNYSAATFVYFSNFNANLYSVMLPAVIDHPVFVELVPLGNGNGLKVGKYSYSIALVDSSGNQTNYSIQTPYIPVPYNAGNGGTPYAYFDYKTYGNAPSSVGSPYGIMIKFRVNNIAGYASVKIRRVYQNEGLAMNYIPVAEELVFIGDIIGNPFAVWEFTDSNLELANWTIITDEQETTETPSSFKCAKAIRYYENILHLGDITYPSKDITDIQNTIYIDHNGALGFPVIENIGNAGHKEIYNQVYFKNNQSGEKESYGVELIDALNNRSFILPYTDVTHPTQATGGMDNVTMPNRRYRMQGDSLTYSHDRWKGAVNAVDINNSPAPFIRTYERFDLGDQNTLGFEKNRNDNITIQDGNYSPLRPVSETDNQDLLDYYINDRVLEDESTAYNYHPAGFNPRYFSQGNAFNGIKKTSLPSWAQGFSIVKKPKLGRVICQGIGTYALTAQANTTNGIGATKATNQIWFYSPELGVGYNPEVADFVANPQNFQVQVVSPLGYFSELYNANYETIHIPFRVDKQVDFITYARLLYNSTTINPNLEDSTPSTSFYTKFGTWRNQVFSGYPVVQPPASGGNDFIYNIQTANIRTSGDAAVGTQDYLQILLSDDIYTQSKIHGLNNNVNTEQSVKDFHEPFYIINIINNNIDYVSSNINSYEETGHLQKLESIIGVANSTAQTLQLVDERWEDCIPNPFSNQVAQITSAENRYCFVGGIRWINITYFDSTKQNTIENDLTVNGVYVDTDGNKCYGVYFNDYINFSQRTFSLIFNSITGLNNQYCIPQTIIGKKTYITVKYDERVPIKLFSGDTYVGESLFCPMQYKTSDNNFNFVNGFPYLGYNTNPNYVIPFVEATLGVEYWREQNRHDLLIGKIRQWCVMFCAETNVNVPLFFDYDSHWGGNSGSLGLGNSYSVNQCFPLVHYTQRPLKYVSTLKNNFGETKVLGVVVSHKIAWQYDQDFPDECQNGRWDYGGFKFMANFNIDYSKHLNDIENSSKPLVGFKEITRFCSEIIWSDTRDINVQDEPNLRTFPVVNKYDMSDKMQEIKYLFDNESEKGTNIFAFTGKGICLLVTNKELIYQTTLSNLAIDNPAAKWISDEYWLSKTIGSNDEMWRGIAEYNNKCYIPNNESIFMLEGTKIVDIVRDKNVIQGTYFSRIYAALQTIHAAYNTPVCAVFNTKDKTYWLKIGINTTQFIAQQKPFNLNNNVTNGEYIQLSSAYNGQIFIMPTLFTAGQTLIIENNGDFDINLQGSDLTTTPIAPCNIYTYTRDISAYGWVRGGYDINLNAKDYVFSEQPDKMAWQSKYDYNFAKMINVKKVNGLNNEKVLGIRNMQTWMLKDDNSTTINEQPVNAYVLMAIAPESGQTKEYINITMNCNVPPGMVQFATDESMLPETVLVSSQFRNYLGNYYAQVGRKTLPPNNRLQWTFFYAKIIHNTNGTFIIRQATSGYKILV